MSSRWSLAGVVWFTTENGTQTEMKRGDGEARLGRLTDSRRHFPSPSSSVVARPGESLQAAWGRLVLWLRGTWFSGDSSGSAVSRASGRRQD